MATKTPDTTPDRYGNYYVEVNDGFCNTVKYYRVAPRHIAQAMQEVESYIQHPAERSIKFVDAGTGKSCQPKFAIDYDPTYDPARICY